MTGEIRCFKETGELPENTPMEDICIDYCEASICPNDCKYLNATDEERAEANRRIIY